MMRMSAWGAIVTALFLANTASAQVQPFEFDKKSLRQSGFVTAKDIREVHLEITNRTGTVEGARLAILRSLGGKAGKMFFLEGEGAGYVDVRFDIRRNPMWLRVEYDNRFIQIQYRDGIKDLVCKRVVDGACYENHRQYYAWGRKFRSIVVKNLNGM